MIIGTESLASNTRKNVQRVFASTGRSSNDINLSSFLPKSFANPFQQIEETQGYAYPASNGLTEIDRYINKIISESFSKALLCNQNIPANMNYNPSFICKKWFTIFTLLNNLLSPLYIMFPILHNLIPIIDVSNAEKMAAN